MGEVYLSFSDLPMEMKCSIIEHIPHYYRYDVFRVSKDLQEVCEYLLKKSYTLCVSIKEFEDDLVLAIQRCDIIFFADYRLDIHKTHRFPGLFVIPAETSIFKGIEDLYESAITQRYFKLARAIISNKYLALMDTFPKIETLNSAELKELILLIKKWYGEDESKINYEFTKWFVTILDNLTEENFVADKIILIYNLCENKKPFDELLFYKAARFNSLELLKFVAHKPGVDKFFYVGFSKACCFGSTDVAKYLHRYVDSITSLKGITLARIFGNLELAKTLTKKRYKLGYPV